MPDSFRSLTRRAAIAACLICTPGLPAAAQQPLGIREAPSSAEFFSRFDFNMAADKIGVSDPRFVWDSHWAGDFDIVDYVLGRVSFLADYQALVGEEFRPFDPYQSSYTLEAMASARKGKTEFVAVLNHVSRHYGDRFNQVAVAQNSLGLRVMRRIALGGAIVDLRGDLRKVIARTYVDYEWISNVDVTVGRQGSGRLGIYSRAFAQLIPVDRAIAGRGPQGGGRLEGGIRVDGTVGSLQVFVGWENVVDADQLDRQSRHWPFFGFRLLGS
jgi:hypothetical protein